MCTFVVCFVIGFDFYYWSLDKSELVCLCVCCPFNVFLVSSSRANSPQTYTTTLFSQTHNGPQCSHCWVPIFSVGLPPTSSSIKRRRAERPSSFLSHCSETLIIPPLLSRWEGDPTPQWWRWLADIQTVSVEGRNRTRVVLCFNEPGSQGKNNCPSKLWAQLTNCETNFNSSFYLTIYLLSTLKTY